MSEKTLDEYQYELPVAILLLVGDPRGKAWPDYPTEYDLTLDHVPDLVRMVQDVNLNWADSESDEVWAPVHAWRTLGQLRAETAVTGLVNAFHFIDEMEFSDWMHSELPDVLAMIGPSSIESLKTYLADNQKGAWSRIAASESLEKIGNQHLVVRGKCVAIISAQLAQFAHQDETLNAFLISTLVDLNALEAVEIMEEAFAGDAVDLSVQGDWEEVQIQLGLLDSRLTPAPEYGWIPSSMVPLAKQVRDGIFSESYMPNKVDKPTVRASRKIGRNEPCPCGSGKKYKRCHGKKT